MANFNADEISGGSVAGGIFNMSDAALIALILSIVQNATDATPLLASGGTIPSAASEVWGVLIG